eukprot:2564410-Pyramimonas_sp.AAC.1
MLRAAREKLSASPDVAGAQPWAMKALGPSVGSETLPRFGAFQTSRYVHRLRLDRQVQRKRRLRDVP